MSVRLAGFFALIAAFWLVARQFGVTERLGPHPEAIVLSFALLLAPYWAFGFGAANWLRKHLPPAARIPAIAALSLPYLAVSIPRGEFQWTLFLAFLAVLLTVALLLTAAKSPGTWHDWTTLALLALSVETHFFDRAWPIAGVTGLAKLVFVDTALYGYLVIRPLSGIGFDWCARWRDLTTGLREFAFYTPIALAIGLATGFLHVHSHAGSAAAFASGWLFTLFFIAMPEELFFRGILLNLLERRFGTRAALAVTAILFGLAHFNKRATGFNWRYVILAAIAGIFYGRAWLANRRLLAPSVTHATVDTVWSIWLR